MINSRISEISAVKTEEVIVTETVLYNGKTESPYTIVTQYWTKSGKLIGFVRDADHEKTLKPKTVRDY